MLSTAARGRLVVVLVGARNPGNIGAAARALHDFGFSDLRLVNDFAAPFEAARLEGLQLDHPAAVAAASVLRTARRFDTLAEAIGDCTMVVGTTAIGERDLSLPVLSLREAAPAILRALEQGEATTADAPRSRVALLFGSEKTGLTNEHLSHCQRLATIPLYSPASASKEGNYVRHLSMNLGQSVAVCLYELTRDGLEGSAVLPLGTRDAAQSSATAGDRERLTQLLLDVLHATGYTGRFPANVTEPLIRHLAQQLGATHREAMTWMGILRQILWRERAEPVE